MTIREYSGVFGTIRDYSGLFGIIYLVLHSVVALAFGCVTGGALGNSARAVLAISCLCGGVCCDFLIKLYFLKMTN